VEELGKGGTSILTFGLTYLSIFMILFFFFVWDGIGNRVAYGSFFYLYLISFIYIFPLFI